MIGGNRIKHCTDGSMKKESNSDREKRVKLIKKSPAYRIAYKDLDFLGSEHARAARLQLELIKTEIGMINNSIKSTIVTFGGTRIKEPSKARWRRLLRKIRVIRI